MDRSRFDLDKIQELAADMSPSYCYLSETTRLFCLDLLTRGPQERWLWRFEDEQLTDQQWDEAQGLIDLAIEELMGRVSNLDDLDDITITEPGDNDLLAYDDGTTQWINQTAGEAGLAMANHNHDHGDLDGLAEEDHSQYHNDARGDARYPLLGRTISTTSPLAGGGDLSANRTLSVGAASESAAGVIPIASTAEVNAGSNDTKAVTPAKLDAFTLNKNSEGFFHAVRASGVQSVNDSTDTVITYDSEVLDSEGWLNAGTGKLLPNRACTMMLSAGLCINSLGAGTYCVIRIRKNGSSVYSQGISIHQAAALEAEYASTSAVVSFNGTTDYIEIIGWHNYGSARDVLGYGAYTWFCGAVVAI